MPANHRKGGFRFWWAHNIGHPQAKRHLDQVAPPNLQNFLRTSLKGACCFLTFDPSRSHLIRGSGKKADQNRAVPLGLDPERPLRFAESISAKKCHLVPLLAVSKRVVAQEETGGANCRFWSMLPLTRASHFGIPGF